MDQLRTTPGSRSGWTYRPLVVSLAVAISLGGAWPASGTVGEQRHERHRPTTVNEGLCHPQRVNGRDLRFPVRGGSARTYRFTLPPQSKAAPLVLNLHGALGTAASQDSMSGLPRIGKQQGFAVLSPQSSNTRVWNLDPEGSDAKYVTALLKRVRRLPCIADSPVVGTGFSMGAMMITTLACRDPDSYSAVVAVSGLIKPRNCGGAAHRSVILEAFQGGRDEVVRQDGTVADAVAMVGGRWISQRLSRAEIARGWLGSRGIHRRVKATADGRRIVFTHGRKRSSLTVIPKMGHAWPRGPHPAADATRTVSRLVRRPRHLTANGLPAGENGLTSVPSRHQWLVDLLDSPRGDWNPFG